MAAYGEICMAAVSLSLELGAHLNDRLDGLGRDCPRAGARSSRTGLERLVSARSIALDQLIDPGL